MSIPGSANPLLLASAAAAPTGYEIERSLRFNSADSAYLNRTPSSAGNRKTWTWSGWVKKNKSVRGVLFGGGTTQSDAGFSSIEFESDDTLRVTGWNTLWAKSEAVYRDYSAWAHVVVSFNSTESSAANQIKLYVNGQQITKATENALTQNADYGINQTARHTIGAISEDANPKSDFYLADVQFIDGQALAPTDFGEFDDNGVWQPIEYAASGPNDGTTWSNSCSGTIYSASLGYANAFDGSLATYSHAANGNTITFTPSSAIPVSSSVRIFCALGSITGSTGTADVTINGTSYVSTANTNRSDGYFTVTGITSITSITWERAADNDLVAVSAIEVDGVTLIDGDTANIGANGFHLPFSDNSTAAALGTDTSGNGNTWTVNNISVTAGAGNDSLVDVPTNGTETDTGVGGEVRGNYATLNPLDKASITTSNGNLDFTHAGTTGNWQMIRGTIGVTSGKWYWETTVTDTETILGIATGAASIANDRYVGNDAYGWGYSGINGQKLNNGSGSSYGNSYTSGDVIGVAFDADAGSLYFYKNGTVQNSGTAAFTGLTSGPYFPAFSIRDTGHTSSINAGQRAFAYSAPSGYKALCTANLDDPTIADGSTAMDVVTYTGNGSTQTISGLDFSPDFVWIKGRSNARNNNLYDTVRGATNYLTSDTTNAENTSSDLLTTFNSDGFSLGNNVTANGSSEAYVSWTWDAGSSTVTNNEGSITSQVRANPSAGFSVVTYTGTGSSATIGHGLNAVPYLIITKRRSDTSSWGVQFLGLGTNYMELQATTANSSSDALAAWNNTNPTSSVFTVNTKGSTNLNGSTYVAYCFAPVEGYSAFGSYVGNGSSDGPMVFTNFRPRWIMFKRTDAAGHWIVFDSARNTYNEIDAALRPNVSDPESTTYGRFDLLSNGVKIRTTDIGTNASSGTYIYAAFAENPFKYARAR